MNHNPLGAWMVLALLLAAALAGASGALYLTDRYWGVAWMIAVHTLSGGSLALLVPLHIAGAIATGCMNARTWWRRCCTVASAPTLP